MEHPEQAAEKRALRDLAGGIVTNIRQSMGSYLLDKRKRRSRSRDGEIYLPTNTYASSRRRCARAMALDLIHPEDWPEFEPETLARFERGDEREEAITRLLQYAGRMADPAFKLVEGQKRLEIKGRSGKVVITGKIDGRVEFEGANRMRFPIEVKDGDSYRNMNSAEEIIAGQWSWGAAWQLLSYMYAENEPIGFFVLGRSGLPAIVPVFLFDHLEQVEAFLQEAEVAYEVRHNKAPLPDYVKERSVCRFCPHLNKSCTPPSLSLGAGVQMITSEDLIKAAKLVVDNRVLVKEVEKADSFLKENLRGVEHGILGPYEVIGKWGKSTSYPDLPDAVKEPYKVVDPKGRFTLKIEPLEAEKAEEPKKAEGAA